MSQAHMILSVSILCIAFLLDPAREYQRGWCASWQLATDVSMRNRDHWRAVLHVSPKPFPAPPVAGEYTDKTIHTLVQQLVQQVVDSADWYVVLQPYHEGETLTFITPGHRAVDCPAPPTFFRVETKP